jgi:hypothetical protein
MATRRRAQPGEGQGAFLIAGAKRRLGRHESQVNKMLTAALTEGGQDVLLDAGARTAARAAARALDVAESKDDVWAVAQATRQLLEVLRELGATPRSRVAGPSDAIADALRELAHAQVDEDPPAS